ncbi:TcfC E-set like domain-containing protein [Vibrio sp. ER1A]|uniref:TcfC E-set like domain-containing protein n=1 Tax=Vibrio sp. ER1A TaxID=1517681 RepID=UPI0004DD8633|nr:TcfC E-set like domain-containing protein [Vibrio sp. ER1A]KFA99255.1 hypothetical protein HW45_04910 [Vibrio sp. ER1A]
MNIRLILVCFGVFAAHAMADSLNNIANLTSIDGRYNNISLTPDASNRYASFSQMKDRKIKLYVVGAHVDPITLESKLSFLKAKILPSEKELLKNYLASVGIDKKHIDEVTGYLIRGVESSTQCKGKKSECLVFEPELSSVVDFYNNSVRLFVPSKMFKTSNDAIVIKSQGENMLVSKFYGNLSYGNNYSTYIIRSNNIQGLGDGYLKYDINLNSYNNSLDKFNYNLDLKKYAATVGLISDNQRLGVAGQNAFFDGKFVGVQLSNQKLREIKKFATKGVEFFSPSNGVLSVYKDDKLVYQKNIASGMNTILYSDLPYGNYDISYDVSKGDAVVFRADAFIPNSSSFDAGEMSTYVRAGTTENNSKLGGNGFMFDAGVSIPLYKQHSLIGSLSTLENEHFLGVGYYANIDQVQFNTKFSISENAHKLNANLSSGYFNLSVNNIDVNRDVKSYLGDEDSLMASLSFNKGVGALSFGGSVSYNETGGHGSYTSLNATANYLFNNGVSLYANYNSGGDSQGNVNIGITIPLFDRNHSYSSMYSNGGNHSQLVNTVSSSYKLNDNITVNSGLSHTYLDNDVDAYVIGNYSNDKINGSAGINRLSTADMNYNGSFSTTAYVTSHDVYLKNSMSQKTSAIEVIGTKDLVKGSIKWRDNISGSKSIKKLTEDSLIEMPPYSQIVVDYEFGNDKYSLSAINIKRHTTWGMLNGKVHYVNVKQKKIGNVLIVSNDTTTKGIVCTGNACVSHQSVNDRVIKFKVEPNKPFSIHKEGKMCFSGIVEHGKTKIGLCES